MSRAIKIGLAVGVLFALVAAGAFVYITRPLEDASEDVQENTQQLSVDEDSADEANVFRISQEESEVSFTIEEVLGGQDTTVIGRTDEVAGDILVNLSNPALSEVGQIRINARTLRTDNSRRDGAIGRFILQSSQDEYEFIEFMPTAITNIAEAVAVGDELEFQIVGDLSISGVTREVTFDVTASYADEDQISGSAETTVLYPDFDLTIPSVPNVASVDEDVILRIDFLADRVTEGEPEVES